MSDPRDQNRFLVRMPDGMRDRLREAAEANNRSMNSEIVSRLEQTFEMTGLEIQNERVMLELLDRLRELALKTEPPDSTPG